MKTIKKLRLNKEKLANLTDSEMNEVKGGSYNCTMTGACGVSSCPCSWGCTSGCGCGYTYNDSNCRSSTYPYC